MLKQTQRECLNDARKKLIQFESNESQFKEKYKKTIERKTERFVPEEKWEQIKLKN